MKCSLVHLQSFDLITSVKLLVSFVKNGHWIRAFIKVKTWIPFSFAHKCSSNRNLLMDIARHIFKSFHFEQKKKLWIARLRKLTLIAIFIAFFHEVILAREVNWSKYPGSKIVFLQRVRLKLYHFSFFSVTEESVKTCAQIALFAHKEEKNHDLNDSFQNFLILIWLNYYSSYSEVTIHLQITFIFFFLKAGRHHPKNIIPW